MKHSACFTAWLLLPLLLSSAACAQALQPLQPQQQADAPSVAAVTVSGTRNPVDKSYRKMLKGMDLFERLHGMAPAASLRYKFLPRQPGTDMEGILLNIAGDTASIPVPVAADHTFTLPRNEKAWKEDAAVMPNRKANSMTWRTEIRTPGLPAHTRRLGDLRLECRVGMEAGLVSDDSPFIGKLIKLVVGSDAYCDAPDQQYLFFSDHPLFSVSLRAGERREILSLDQLYAGISRHPMPPSELAYCDCQVLLDRTYFLPLGDKSWPDDTLVELEYMEDGVPPSAGAKAESGTDAARETER
ncbi:hypothetical protein GCM10011396_40470 [Undibacterium terreum]|uniref:Uncharacterized protein n=1 Tax=Undibacterium terreum TaxID=1224302 RepID=A0A916UVT3_9BURK|nr:hypothetical protein GCM10011396_40470 [Undibacterium terreum]